ncbi:adenosylcobinamide-GDP ribazoletransferase [Alsobacter metallidurans]|uniref:Adenosylcobinamide-GDP ribazoletransferase n=1 Tax=Alsobacter metallidurans TaxID=340221 RepID=A0A917MH43_9HYPH|nr:adenosylcobinamide-GDP ribazoletransferase [Alsobacter metallidurans]GGH14230.1 adenosylcobinamide-GDP ribazoletransferase [Alsobacter metallidurans]
MSFAPADTPPPVPPSAWRGLAVDLVQCLRFYTRLPTPRLSWEGDPHAAPDFTRAPRMLPLAGAAVGAVGGLALMLASAAGLPPIAAAALALAALVAATGAFHEDGLADMADGFWGGSTPERRLEIMADSRLGSYGATALGLALLLRFAAIAGLLAQAGAGRTALAIVAAASVSRVVGLTPLWALPSARPGGRSASVGRPNDAIMGTAFAGAAVICAVLLLPVFGPGRALIGFGLAALSAWPLIRLARAKIGGQTGDVAGAGAILAETVMLMALLAGLR